jgi:hypothetical protein
MHGMQLTVRNPARQIIGTIWHSGCDNDFCLTEIVNGKPWHACPSQSGVDLPGGRYHFRTVEDGIQALREAFTG